MRCCHLLLTPLATWWHTRDSHNLLFNEVIQGKHWEEDVWCWLLNHALQNNSSQCLVLILHRQLGTVFLVLGFMQVTVWQTRWLLTKTKDSMQNWIMLLICSSDIWWKTVSNWSKNSSKVNCLQDKYLGNISHQSHSTSTGTQRHMCPNNT